MLVQTALIGALYTEEPHMCFAEVLLEDIYVRAAFAQPFGYQAEAL